MKLIKKTLIGFAVFSSFAAMAGGPLNSTALRGEYELVETSGTYAQSDYCSQVIKVSVNEKRVYLTGIRDGLSRALFSGEKEGCSNRQGDIGPLRTSCVRFNKRSVSNSRTSLLTIVGFIREVEKISLKGHSGNKLVYSNSVTQIPFGIVGVGDDDEFECVYERMEK